MSELDHLDVVAAMRDPRGLGHLLKLQEIATMSDNQADGMKCSGLTEEEAQNWPLDSSVCSECKTETVTSCGFCGMALCEQLDCIMSHANKYDCGEPSTTGGES